MGHRSLLTPFAVYQYTAYDLIILFTIKRKINSNKIQIELFFQPQKIISRQIEVSICIIQGDGSNYFLSTRTSARGLRGGVVPEGRGTETPTHCTRGTRQIVESWRQKEGSIGVFKGPNRVVGKKWNSEVLLSVAVFD